MKYNLWVPLEDLESTPSGLVLLYHFLLLHKELSQMKTEVKDEWFPCSETALKKSLLMTKTKQNRYLTALVKLEWIEVKRSGMPAKRWVKITRKSNGDTARITRKLPSKTE